MPALVDMFENIDATISSYSTLLLATIVIAFLLIFSFKWLSSPSKTKRHLPSSPRGLIVIGNLHQLGLRPHRSLWSMAKRHGNLMLLRFCKVPVLVASSADIASEIMKSHDIAFANRPKSSISRRLLYDCKDVASAPYGEYWRQTKSILVLHLLGNRRVKSFHTVREEETSLMIDRINQATAIASPINLSEMFMTITNDVVCRIALGTKFSGQKGSKFKDLLIEFAEVLGAFDVGDYLHWLKWINQVNGFNARVNKVAKGLDDILEGVIEDRLAYHKGGCEDIRDFVDILLLMQKENTLGFPLDRVSIKALLLDMFAAGTDTIFTAIEWAMSELIRHPEVMKKLQKEIRRIADGKPLITENDLDDMRYLEAIIKEALRLHPPIPLLVMRESSQDVNVQGYDIAVGTQVIINAWAIGRDPTSWERAEEFWPERFLNSSIDVKGHDFQLIPFGAGRRGCPGIQFAMIMIELVLANLVNKFDWSLCGGARAEDLDMTEACGLSVHRKLPLIVVPTSYSC